jgi:hypothetical protein
MTDTTIADIAREKVVLDGDEDFEGQDVSGSFKSHVGAIRGVGVVDVTASVDDAVNVGPYPQLVLVTTTGDGSGVDLINVVNPTMDANGLNLPLFGQSIIVVLQTLTDPADYVNITIAGSNTAPAVNVPVPATGYYGLINTYRNIRLVNPGDAIMLRWAGQHWTIDGSVGEFTADATSNVDIKPSDNGSAYITAGDGSFTAGDLNLSGGVVQNGSNKGGAVIVRAGSSNDIAGNGGDVTLDAGGGANSNGNVLIGSIVSLPTADPLLLGALFVNGPIVPGTPLALFLSTGPAV